MIVRKRQLLIITSLVIALACLTYGAVLFHDYMLLKDSSFFADGVIGPGAQIPSTVHAYNRLKASPFAVLIFKHLEKSGSSEGKVYALKALKKLDSDYFWSLADKYEANKVAARCMSGCIMSTIFLDSLFEQALATPSNGL